MRIESLKMMPAGIKAANEIQPSASEDKTFGQFLANALSDTNKLQQDADKASLNLAAGKIEDVSEVVIAAEKASVALQLTVQVRNKIVEAYQEVMRMQV